MRDSIESALVERLRGRDEGALAELSSLYGQKIFQLAFRYVRNHEDAEEVVQDVFGQIWRDAARYQANRASVAGWIVMLTRTRAIDRLRSRRARPDLGAGEGQATANVSSVAPSPEQLTISAQQVSRLREALTTLPESLRAIVELAYFEGLTHSEIADRTRLPLGTVKTRLRSAMATLRGVLA